ncbi:3-deoxy-8-phosphooctulonate synthase [bacterium]|nr:3-deoxy-8-phosphooctulonate synthase [Candidatus Omnitrophota bacterium]MBU2528312.1 3-deoxy-8-phosphooctulonate synthase [bacterium]MBU3930043.1 3-deoxy-8-phosphooctulonate synthase [bacterium]MBU4123453.1 3-deoxy-8-phosphooctulonate synthase [bacterium]
MSVKKVRAGSVTIGKGLSIIAGVCSIENKKQVFDSAEALVKICAKHKVPLIFKASFDKANRMQGSSWRGPGMKKGLEIMSETKKRFGFPVLTDVHCVSQVAPASKIADILQIPAFLCRQTDLITAVAGAGKPVSIKKGQFLAPDDMKFLIKKAEEAGSKNIILIERGSSFGYNNLVVDFRSIPIMKKSGYPVIFDATHSVQLPGAGGGRTSGKKEFCLPLSRAAVAVGADGIYAEVHPNPAAAKSDRGSVMSFDEFDKLVAAVKEIAG